jgi:hypothetical protein
MDQPCVESSFEDQTVLVVIETEGLRQATGRSGSEKRQILETFVKLFNDVSSRTSVIKLLIVNYGGLRISTPKLDSC